VSVAAITVVPLSATSQKIVSRYQVSLIPLATTIRGFTNIVNNSYDGLVILKVLANFVGNIIMFIPLGFLLPLLASKFDDVKRLIFTAALLSISIELLQFISISFGTYRFVDIDDVMLNTFGAFMGYLLFQKTLKRYRLAHLKQKPNL
jgi:glycopeptide antibiotics resistance protein